MPSDSVVVEIYIADPVSVNLDAIDVLSFMLVPGNAAPLTLTVFVVKYPHAKVGLAVNVINVE